ncbi:AAA family ATPase [Nonomuraea sp. NPDC049152]|uniref:MinD/ParA family ATP-binding protein n=1 Tax=Nonomuraea sp. NPDC049152 TaxID=3154350 RepID=UPI003410C1F9
MARHDREESLEEQLAWLDAIKENDEEPVKVSAKTGAVSVTTDDTVVSPYPKDPWLSVPTEQDTPTPPLFRAAVDSVYGPEAAEELPAEEAEAAEWFEAAVEVDRPPAFGRDDDDAFMAPLKPLPRPDDTDSYRMTAFDKPRETASEGSMFDPLPPEERTDPSWPQPPWPQPSAESFEGIADVETVQGEVVDTKPSLEPPRQEEPTFERFTFGVRPEAEGPEAEHREASSHDSEDHDSESHQSEGRDSEGHQSERSDSVRHRSERREDERLEVERHEVERTAFERHEPRRHDAQRREVERQSFEHHFQRRDERPWAEEPSVEVVVQEEPFPVRRHSQPPVPVFTAPPRPSAGDRPTAESLDPDSLLRGRRNAPSKGWRRLVYKASAGWIKPGEPADVRRRRALVTRARTPVSTGHHRVAVLSLKGGVGKTTTTVGLGATLAQVRGDRVIAVDANPDRGTLSDKLELETSATVRDLLNERAQVKRYVDIRAFTSQATSRLEVLASDRDPSVSEAFSAADYQQVAQVLENFYSICITDCGTGLLHSAMSGVLGLADQIVLVSSPSVDGARAASATLDWLEAHHYGDLVRDATVVLCSVRPRSKSAVDIAKLEAHFAARCRTVIRVPYDPHLEEGAEIDLDRLQEPTRDAYLQLAAAVGDGLAGA